MAADLISETADRFYLPGGEKAILLIHGFTGSPAHMRPLGEHLNRAGMTVLGIRLTGHGTDVRDMQAARWTDWLDDARRGYETLKQSSKDVSAAGLSMGGVLALLLAEEFGSLRAAVTLSAPMGIANPLGRYGHLIGLFMPFSRKRVDPARESLDARYDIGYDSIPVARCHDLDILIGKARENLSLIRCPILCVQSESDRTVTKDSADVILSGVSSPLKRRLTLETSPHVITIGPETDILYPAVTGFLLDPAGSRPA